ITEYLVNISKRRAFWSLNEDILKINDSDYQYAVSIKEDTAYPCLHSPKTTKERRSIRRIQRRPIRHIGYMACEYSGRYQTWSLLQETPIRQMDLFAFINHADPTKVRIVEKEVAEREGASNYNVNEEGGDVAVADQTGKSDHIVQVGGIDIVADDKTQVIVSDKPKRLRKKRKAADGASGSGLPPKKLREDHGLLYRSTLAAKIGATAAATVSFVTSFVTPTPELEGGGHGDSIAGPNLRTQLASERFVVLTDFSHHSSTHAADDEVTSIASTRQVPPSIFRDPASIGEANQDIACPSHLVGIELSTDSFFVSQDVNSETLYQIYIPKWNVTNDSALDDPDIFRGVIDHLAHPVLFSQLRRKKFKDKCAMQAGWLKEKRNLESFVGGRIREGDYRLLQRTE
ncbi:hypothetical protein Tco_0111576, partial [Tanacetum coccineum]